MEYIKLFELLYEQKIRYLICGGLAMNIYGIPRMTVDIDLLIDFDNKNVRSFLTMLESLNYKPVLPVNLETLIDKSKRKEVIKNRNLIAFSFYNQLGNYMQLDVLLDSPFDFFEMWNKRVIRKSNGFKIYLVCVEQLIKMKEYSNRIQDKDDIILLNKYKKNEINKTKTE